MNVFNRIVVTLLLLGIAAAAGYSIAIASGFFVADARIVGPEIADRIDRLRDLETGRRIAIGAGAGGVLIVALLLLRSEIFGSRNRRPFLVDESSLGRITVDRNSVCNLVDRTVGHLEFVEAVKTSVGIGDSGLRVSCRVVASNTAVLQELGPRIQEEAAARIQAQFGLPVENVSTRIRMTRPDERALL